MKNKKIKPLLVYLIPITWFILGLLYSRSLDAWAGIGMMILVIISTIGLFAGSITWHITKKIIISITITIITSFLLFFLIIFLTRIGY